MNAGLLQFLHMQGFTLDENGRAVPLVVGPDPFAVALMPVPRPVIPDGPSPKSARRREKLARAVARKPSPG